VVAKASRFGLVKQIILYENLQKLVPINFADLGSCIIVVGNVGGILCKQVTDDLIDGIVAFFVQGVENITESLTHLLPIIAGNLELSGNAVIVRHVNDLLFYIRDIIPHYFAGVKSFF
jgi:hypothetical protein